jgi:hypothetical protein
MEKKSDIQKSSSKIRKPSKARQSKVITSDMRKNKKGDPQSQRMNKPEKENESTEARAQQQPDAQQNNDAQQKKVEQKIVNEDEQKQVVNNPRSGNSPTEAEDQK